MCVLQKNGKDKKYEFYILAKNLLQFRRPRFDSWLGKICWRRDRQPTSVFLGFPCGSAGKESACNVGDLGLIPGLGRFPWKRKQVPTLVLWPGEFHGLYSPSRSKESDTIEPLSLSGTRVEEGRREANTRCHAIQLITASKPSLFLRETISRYCILQ